MRLSDDPTTTELLVTQLGLIARSQLTSLGWSAKAVDGSVRRGHLQVVHRGVYRIPGSGQPDHQPALAAVLRAGTGARITGEPVLRRLDLPWLDAGSPGTVLLAPPRRLTGKDVLWRPDAAPDHDHDRLGPIPATTPARAFVELASGWTRHRQLTAADHLRWSRLATVGDVVSCAKRLGRRHPGARAVLELHHSGDLEQESHGERQLAGALARLGLATLVRWQVDLMPHIRVDCLLPVARAVLEYDGRDHHTHRRDRAADARRDRQIRDLGYRVVRLTHTDLRTDGVLRARLEADLGIDVTQLAEFAA